MKFQEKSLTKLCSFYVSDWHLVTMLLPYISQKVNEKTKIATILEKSIEENVKTLVEKLNLKNKEEILNINWNKSNGEKILPDNFGENERLIILVNGSKGFIEKQNKKLESYFSVHAIKNKIKVINCYDVIKLEGNIKEILDKHNKILNTSGEKEKEDVFFEYEAKKRIG